MKQFLFFCLSFLFIFVSIGRCELLIAVPDTSQAQHQIFDAFFIKSTPTPATGRSSQFQVNNFMPRSQGQIQYQNQPLNNLFDLLQTSPSSTRADSKSFNVFKQDQNQFDIGRSDKGAVTITIKLQPNELLALQGQGSNVRNTYSQMPHPTVATNIIKETANSATNSMIKVGNSIAEILNGGERLLIAKPENQIITQEQNIIAEVPIYESNSFLKSMKNLITSQIASMIDTPNRSKPLQQSPSQQYALFTTVSESQKQKQPQNQLTQNIANFLTHKPQPQKFNQLRSQIEIARPQNNVLPLGTTTTESTAGETIGQYGDNSSPIYTAASAIANSVYQIPSNLDLMFNDMGRIYRKNLFHLRDSFADMRSFMQGGSSSNTKINTEPWLDGYGA